MKQFNDMIRLSFIGMGIGSFLTLASVCLHQSVLTIHQWVLLMIMSAIMGLVSIIFNYDRLSFVVQLIVHFFLEMGTYLIFITLTFGKIMTLLANLPSFIVIYVVIFIYMYHQGQENARRINEQLANKKKE